MKAFIYVLGLIVLLGGSFYGGLKLRLASIQRPLHQSRLAQSIDVRAGAYAVSQGKSPNNSLFPSAMADSAVSNDSSANSGSGSEQLEEFLNSDSPAATFDQVYMLLKEEYVDKIDSDIPLAHGAAASLVTALDDPNSRFMSQDERVAIEQQSKGIFDGIGAAVMVRKVTRPDNIVDRQLTIVDTFPGSGAEKAGLKTGDVISTINGHWVLSYDPFADQADALKKLQDDPYDFNKAVDALEKKEAQAYGLDKAQTLLDTTSATPIELTVRRPGVADPMSISVNASVPLLVQSVEFHKLANGTGYIGINVFDDSTASQFQDAISQLDPSKGLIIDLRDCSGGLLTPGIQIAKAFDSTGEFGSISLRAQHGSKTLVDGVPTEVKELKDNAANPIPAISAHGAITVLTNKGTANSAEMLAAFLHDRLGASLIGSNTFGDATAQTLFPLSDGSAFTLTTGIMKTDKSVAFNGIGLAPQYALADPGHAGDSDSDASISKAITVLATQASMKSALGSASHSNILQTANAGSQHAVLGGRQ